MTSVLASPNTDIDKRGVNRQRQQRSQHTAVRSLQSAQHRSSENKLRSLRAPRAAAHSAHRARGVATRTGVPESRRLTSSRVVHSTDRPCSACAAHLRVAWHKRMHAFRFQLSCVCLPWLQARSRALAEAPVRRPRSPHGIAPGGERTDPLGCPLVCHPSAANAVSTSRRRTPPRGLLARRG